MKDLPEFAELIFNSQESHATTRHLQDLLIALDDPSSVQSAVLQLHQLAAMLEREEPDSDLVAKRNLFIKTLQVPGIDEPIKVLLNSAVFSPEFWGRTFAEGILKNSESFSGKSVVELGTGSGWISLLLLKRTSATSVLGLDINPIAVLLANINKWLNGTKSDGSLIVSPAGIPIPKAFKAEVSDLLGYALAEGAKFDRIIGCIPQVLHPVPEKEQSGDLSYEDLYDLSNYCFNQGILEDRFGLPLIARALEEAQLCLNPSGQLLFILGGRPGQQAIEEVFKRRGYKPNLAWVRRIQQADDTDLIQLVELEKAYGIKFHFFSSTTSRQSIPASTAVGLQRLGQKIYHDLLVYQAETQFEKPTLAFVRNIHKLNLDSLRKELDFSRASDEQMSFLERLSSELLSKRRIPYPHEKGDHSFRQKLARFLALYCHYPVHPDDLFVGAEREQMLAMILKMVARVNDKILLSSSLEPLYAKVFEQHQGLEVVLGNNDLDELLELESVFQPRISVFSPQQLRQLSPIVLDKLIEHARAHPDRWYLVDDSENFDIGSHLQSNLLMRLLAQKQAPPNLIFLYGLIKNTVCPDFELSFLINAPREWVDGLEYCAELSYSRISYIVQLYYEWLFDELLSFQFAEEGSPSAISKTVSGLSLSEPFKKVSADPIFAPKPINPDDADVIRLDYGEFEADIPDLLLKGLVKGFLESGSEDLSLVVQHRVAAYLNYTRQIEVDPRCIALGQGSFPLLGALVQVLRDRLGRPPLVAIGNGTYGPIFPMLSYYGAEIELIQTDESNGFAVSADLVRALPLKPDLLLIAQPSNPSGIFLDAAQLEDLAKYCAENEVFICADEIFFLLSDAQLGNWTPSELSLGHHLKSPYLSRCAFVVDGLAKAFAAGGLRCGFILCPDRAWAEQMRAYSSPIPQAILRAWDRLYSVFLESSPHQLIDIEKEHRDVEEYLLKVRTRLSNDRNNLLSILRKYGVADSWTKAKRGALFVLAKTGKVSSALAKEQKILTNSGDWGRTGDWARFCFCIDQDKLEQALSRIDKFFGDSKSRS